MLIILQLLRISYVFAYQREGFHSDETWSYGFANSFFMPHIYLDESGNVINFDKWVSGQTLRDYIVVNTGETFRFDSVYDNQKNDLSPPLHSMLLHAVSSLFPETFSWYYAFAINALFFILTQVTLFFLGLNMTRSRMAALLGCLFYGFTAGALNCFIYLRMYGMLTFLAVASALLHSRMYRKEFIAIGRELALLVLVTVAGALTHYYFFILSFFLAAAFCGLLLIRRHWRSLFAYTGSMLLAAALALALFPYALQQLGRGTGLYAHQMPYSWNLETVFYLLIRETTGINIIYSVPVLLAYAALPAIVTLVFVAAAAFLFRKEPWFSRMLAGIRQWPAQLCTYYKGPFRDTGLFPSILLLTILATAAVIARISQVLYMGPFTDRYLLFLMPLLCLLLIWSLAALLRRRPAVRLTAGRQPEIPPTANAQPQNRPLSGIRCARAWLLGRRILALLLLATMMVLNIGFASDHYLFHREAQGEPIEQLTQGADVILLTREYWHLTVYASMLRDVHQLYPVYVTHAMSMQPRAPADPGNRPLYVLLETELFLDENNELIAANSPQFASGVQKSAGVRVDEYLTYLGSLIEGSRPEKVATQKGFTGSLELYRLK